MIFSFRMRRSPNPIRIQLSCAIELNRFNRYPKISVSKTKTDDLCQVRCFNTELVTQLRETLPSEDTLEDMMVIFGALAGRSPITKIAIRVKTWCEIWPGCLWSL